MTSEDADVIAGWFAGPKAENAPVFSHRLEQIVSDYYAWRRNYWPEDGAVIGSAERRKNDAFQDAFEDRLLELLARLKGDVPFQSPRYAGHMLAEQTMPAIAGYFAAMLYNPNNVTADVAPVTVRLELEAGQMLARMIGYDCNSWAHLCSGGTAANLEALWLARSTRYVPWVVRDVRATLGLPESPLLASRDAMLALAPGESLALIDDMWRDGRSTLGPSASQLMAQAIEASAFNVKRRGLHTVCARVGSTPVLLGPETMHYSFEKILDLLGLGSDHVELVPVGSDFRMRVDALADSLARLDAEGKHALAVVAVVGSTEEGSVDPVDQIAALALQRRAQGKPSFWLHGDGAYGAYLRTVTIPSRVGLGAAETTVRVAGQERVIALTLPEHAECTALEALPQCDSVTIDPHKLGYIPYPAGAVCYKSNGVKTLARQEAAYIADASAGPEQDRESDAIGLYVLEGSKPGAAAAAVWLSHSLIPLDTGGHGRLIRENIRNACELHALLEQYPEIAQAPAVGVSTSAAFGKGAVATASAGAVAGAMAGASPERVSSVRAVCLCPPGSNIVCYAFRPLGHASLAEVNALNRALFAQFSLHGARRAKEQAFFVSRMELSAARYRPATMAPFLARLGVHPAEYEREGVFMLRSVLMNPWYAHSKRRGRHVLSELVEALYASAAELVRDGVTVAAPARTSNAVASRSRATQSCSI